MFNGLILALQTLTAQATWDPGCAGTSCSIFSAAYFLIIISTSLYQFSWPHKPALHHSTLFKKLCKDTISNKNKIKFPTTGPRHAFQVKTKFGKSQFILVLLSFILNRNSFPTEKDCTVLIKGKIAILTEKRMTSFHTST